ncbi:MAG: tetratricopeptide repeat protein [Polyangiales bacterium]
MARRVEPSSDAAALRRQIERAIGDEPPEGLARPDSLVPPESPEQAHARGLVTMLERLQQMAQEGTDDRRFADRQLAEILLEADPWRAAMLIKRLLAHDEDDASVWALMGLAQALLGYHRFAGHAYRRALASDPGNPYYAHNLGHLLDVALDDPTRALSLLAHAHSRLPASVPIACSYAHALWRSGDVTKARTILAPILADGGGVEPDVAALAAELGRADRKARAARGAPRGEPSADAKRAWAADLVATCAMELSKFVDRDRVSRARSRRLLGIVERFAAARASGTVKSKGRARSAKDVLTAAFVVSAFSEGATFERALTQGTSTANQQTRVAPLAREMIDTLGVRSRTTARRPRAKV